MNAVVSIRATNSGSALSRSRVTNDAARTGGRPDGLRMLIDSLATDPKWDWVSSLSAMLMDMQQTMSCTGSTESSSREQYRYANHFSLDDSPLGVRSVAERYRVLLRIHAALTGRLTDIRDALGPAAEPMLIPGKQTDQGLSRWQERRAKTYMTQNLGTRVSNAEIAAICGLSQNYFVTAFRKRTGETPHACLVRYRVEKAKQLLGGPMSLADVALSCGFSDQSHLTRVFRKHAGVGPGEWRRERRDTRDPSCSPIITPVSRTPTTSPSRPSSRAITPEI
jgi:AraC-like DNA-binding protein